VLEDLAVFSAVTTTFPSDFVHTRNRRCAIPVLRVPGTIGCGTCKHHPGRARRESTNCTSRLHARTRPHGPARTSSTLLLVPPPSGTQATFVPPIPHLVQAHQAVESITSSAARNTAYHHPAWICWVLRHVSPELSSRLSGGALRRLALVRQETLEQPRLCSNCHNEDTSGPAAPTWSGVFGSSATGRKAEP